MIDSSFNSVELIYQRADLISESLCATIIAKFEGDSGKHPGKAYRNDSQAKEQNDKLSTDLSIPPEGTWSNVHQQIHQAMFKGLDEYMVAIPGLGRAPMLSSGYKIQKYEQNKGFFSWHCDAMWPATQSRQIAVVMFLNTLEAGGETVFLNQKVKYKPQAGSALFFPTFWTHTHSGQVPVSGDKYIISSFFEFDFSPATGSTII